MEEPTCSLIVDGRPCGEPVYVEKRGWCRKHQRRYLYAGDPLAPDLRKVKRDAEERFLEKVDKDAGLIPAHRPELGRCWVWTGAAGEKGYGTFWDEGEFIGAHRWSYQHFVKPIPAGLEVDHICHPGDGSCPFATCPHHACVNPDHLEPVTRRVNTLRGYTIAAINLAATHCPAGHPYDEENTYYDGRGRRCRTCARKPSKGVGCGANNRVKTHCPQGHPYDEANTFYIKDGGGRRCRICMKAQKAARTARAKAAAAGTLF
jgi:hypothetical protein